MATLWIYPQLQTSIEERISETYALSATYVMEHMPDYSIVFGDIGDYITAIAYPVEMSLGKSFPSRYFIYMELDL